MLLLMPLAQGLNQTANIIKGFAIAIGIAIAIAFVWMWWLHRQRERRQELAARTQAIWSAWLRLAVTHPELADPGLGAIGEPAEISRYRAFVACLVSTAGEILLLDGTPAWREAIGRQLAAHASYLASSEFQVSVLPDCTAEVRHLISGLTGASTGG